VKKSSTRRYEYVRGIRDQRGGIADRKLVDEL
jgi:hypothetical protein